MESYEILREIAERMNKIDVVGTGPKEKTEKGDKKIGFIRNEETKKYFYLVKIFDKELEKAWQKYDQIFIDCKIQKRNPDTDPELISILEEKIMKLKYKKVAENLLNLALFKEFPQTETSHLEIRENWIVVAPSRKISETREPTTSWSNAFQDMPSKLIH